MTYSIEDRKVGGETEWVAIRARGAEWSWLTSEEAFEIGKKWAAQYDPATRPARPAAPKGPQP